MLGFYISAVIKKSPKDHVIVSWKSDNSLKSLEIKNNELTKEYLLETLQSPAGSRMVSTKLSFWDDPDLDEIIRKIEKVDHGTTITLKEWSLS